MQAEIQSHISNIIRLADDLLETELSDDKLVPLVYDIHKNAYLFEKVWAELYGKIVWSDQRPLISMEQYNELIRPLTFVCGYADIALRVTSIELSHQQRLYLEEIENRGTIIKEFVWNLTGLPKLFIGGGAIQLEVSGEKR